VIVQVKEDSVAGVIENIWNVTIAPLSSSPCTAKESKVSRVTNPPWNGVLTARKLTLAWAVSHENSPRKKHIASRVWPAVIVAILAAIVLL
jgi:hypothetical protein